MKLKLRIQTKQGEVLPPEGFSAHLEHAWQCSWPLQTLIKNNKPIPPTQRCSPWKRESFCLLIESTFDIIITNYHYY